MNPNNPLRQSLPKATAAGDQLLAHANIITEEEALTTVYRLSEATHKEVQERVMEYIERTDTLDMNNLHRHGDNVYGVIGSEEKFYEYAVWMQDYIAECQRSLQYVMAYMGLVETVLEKYYREQVTLTKKEAPNTVELHAIVHRMIDHGGEECPGEAIKNLDLSDESALGKALVGLINKVSKDFNMPIPEGLKDLMKPFIEKEGTDGGSE